MRSPLLPYAFRSAVVASLLALPLLGSERGDRATVAERSGFTRASTLEEARAYCERLAALSPHVAVSTFGRSGAGRALPLVVVSKAKAFTPAQAAAAAGREKPVVLLLGSIHGGELDGTEASLLLLRDLVEGKLPRVLDGVTLLVVPVYNVDGHARVSRWNRPNQNGPAEGMGFRTNARGLDLNRDLMKADAPETRALLALAQAWRPDLLLDQHVTDGADFQPALTLSYADEPSTPPPLADLLRRLVPAATKAIESLGVKSAPYVDFLDPLDPTRGFVAGPSQPRYATGYFPLRGTGAVLVEMHAIKPFGERVRANHLFLRALLEEVAARGAEVRAASAAARRLAAAAAPKTPVVLDGVADRSRPEPYVLAGYAWDTAVSPVTGERVLRWDPSRPRDIELPFFAHLKPTVTVPRPAGYVVPAGWPTIAERLAAHGIRFEEIGAARTLRAGTYRVADASFARAPYQGRTRVTAAVARAEETRAVPAGSLWVPLDQELAPVAMALLEPEGPDSLFAWGELSAALESKEWIDLRVLDPLAEKLLEEPEVKRLFEERLKDPGFAGSSRARVRFFHERTPYFDESLGLLPVYRLGAPLEAMK